MNILLTPHSSMVFQLGYDADAQALYVVYNTGVCWRYDVVPPEIWDCLRGTDSIGRVMTTMVKPVYQGRSVDTPKEMLDARKKA